MLRRRESEKGRGEIVGPLTALLALLLLSLTPSFFTDIITKQEAFERNIMKLTAKSTSPL